MPIKVTCSGCKSKYNIKDEFEGKNLRCSKCNTLIEIIKWKTTNKKSYKTPIIIISILMVLTLSFLYAYKSGFILPSNVKTSLLDIPIKKVIKKELASEKEQLSLIERMLSEVNLK